MLLQVLGDRWRILLLVEIACLAGGLAYLRHSTPLYSSVSRVYVEESGSSVGRDLRYLFSQGENCLTTQCELMKSSTILRDALEQGGLRKLATFAAAGDPLDVLREHLSVGVGEKDDIINLQFVSRYPEDSARVANAVAAAYVRYHSQRTQTATCELLNVLRDEKENRDRELASKLQKMLTFKRENGTLSFESDSNTILHQRLATLSAALTRTQIDVIDARTEDETAKAAEGDPARLRQLMEDDRGDSPAGIRTMMQEELGLSDELNELHGRLTELRENFSDRMPGVKALAARVETLKERLARCQARRHAEDAERLRAFVIARHQRWLAAKSREAALREELDAQQKLVEAFNIKAAEHALLRADVVRSERALDVIHGKIKDLSVAQGSSPLNIAILEQAEPADAPCEPKRGRVLATFSVVGMLAGLGLVLGLDWSDKRIRSAAEVRARLGAPVLSVVPYIDEPSSVKGRCLKTHLEPTSDAAEAYRAIRTAVMLGVHRGDTLRSVLVSSPTRGEGKTTIACNLATAMAQAGRRTLLVDASLEEPALHKIFDSPGGGDVSGVPWGADPDHLIQAIRHSEIENLDLLLSGPEPPEPSGTLNVAALEQAMGILSERYEYVIVDSSPILSRSDTRITAAICDATIMVLEPETSTREMNEAARDALLSVGARLLGAAVNNVGKGNRPFSPWGERAPRVARVGGVEGRRGHGLAGTTTG
ncbi:MAG: polysaccharide biosynthesis tyrosine autokinase [Phycisphaerae bacterium]|nr:polysaccharide biosynthesis tyrosine autokinase [Phycisphaerae bacterium]